GSATVEGEGVERVECAAVAIDGGREVSGDPVQIDRGVGPTRAEAAVPDHVALQGQLVGALKVDAGEARAVDRVIRDHGPVTAQGSGHDGLVPGSGEMHAADRKLGA